MGLSSNNTELINNESNHINYVLFIFNENETKPTLLFEAGFLSLAHNSWVKSALVVHLDKRLSKE